MTVYCKMPQKIITKCVKFLLQNVTVLLQNATFITNCDSTYIVQTCFSWQLGYGRGPLKRRYISSVIVTNEAMRTMQSSISFILQFMVFIKSKHKTYDFFLGFSLPTNNNEAVNKSVFGSNKNSFSLAISLLEKL